ncbi:capsular biosynthesis protein [Robbsia andropogonis]|uniref:Capsular biosynthesis protein n=1 Tax=Robbsia andropogonis TaxID=28092 RepID=A0A0F5K5I6_9BURK|nr:NAD-dependent epimerase/dehydratase family protein [Robbsia andropogonis]KKB65363.1 capsular biosynthesis protein [Robbsia andropogonis]MCP1117331.1 NAD-dependent epimerase/dehydratase family protein [Robbsia andropogonis]MCP1129274.1 NAD-dependent epimerase/dehydratase family protein [Robbsia andropogonis]
MKTRILVLGATGFVGKQVVTALAATDWAEPVAASRRAGDGVEQVDGTDAVSLGAAIAKVDGVINCLAGAPDAIVANARALRTALDTHLPTRAQPIPVVYFSSMAVYGNAEGRIDEDAPLAASSAYGLAKVEAERLLGVLPSVTFLRPGCIYGRGSPQWSKRIADLLRARRIGDLGAAGDGNSNLVHVDDVVQAALLALRSPRAPGRAYNLAMANAPRWNEYFVTYGRALGATPIRRIGARRMKFETKLLAPALKLAEIAGRKAGIHHLPPALPPSLARLWQQDIRLDVQRAEEELGLSWTSLQTALQEEAGKTGPA